MTDLLLLIGMWKLCENRKMSSISVEAVTSSTILGEGPHWDATENVLYYVDIAGKEVRKYNPATKRETIAKIDGAAVSFIIPVDGQKNKFLVGVGRNISLMTWDGESTTPSSVENLAVVDEDKTSSQVNDGKADASGRLWTGTFSLKGVSDVIPKEGSIFSFSKNKSVSKHVGEITCSNGLTWSQDNKTFYYIDTFTHKVDAFDFDLKNGVLSNRRTAFDFKANDVIGMPDGMTIDTNDKLWIACFNGSQVIQIDPKNGKLLQSIPIPCLNATSVAFGGPNLDELYVTTATFNMSPELKEEYPTAGCTFRLRGINAKGLPMHSIKL